MTRDGNCIMLNTYYFLLSVFPVTGVLYLGGHRLASCSHDASIRGEGREWHESSTLEHRECAVIGDRSDTVPSHPLPSYPPFPYPHLFPPVWDLDHLTSAHVIEEAHDSPIAMLCEAGERNEFASLAFELAAKVWCATTYQLLYRLEGGHTAEVRGWLGRGWQWQWGWQRGWQRGWC